MRTLLFAIMVVPLCGCTAFQAQENTVNLGVTAGNIETRQILQQLGETIDDPDRLPLMITLNTGQTNVQNAIAANWQVNSLASNVLSATTNTSQRTLGFGPPITGQYTDQWTMNPISDPDDITRLRCVFSFPVRKARGEITDLNMTYDQYSAKWCERQAPKKGAMELRYKPPSQPFFAFRQLSDPSATVHGVLDCPHDTIVELGDFSGNVLIACRKLYHDFELSVLAAPSITKGGEVTVKTPKGTTTTRRYAPKFAPQILQIPPLAQ